MNLTGCDAATDNIAEILSANEPTIVIPEGFQIDISGRSVPVQGFDECPKQDKTMSQLFGPSSNEGQSTCIVLAKDRDSVPVSIFLPTGTVREEWNIIRNSEKTENGKPYTRTSLRRPDGSFVIPAKKGRI
jgi:hypothetical protein